MENILDNLKSGERIMLWAGEWHCLLPAGSWK